MDREQLEKNHHDRNRFREQTYGYQGVRWEDRGVPAGPPELGVMGRHPRGVREEPCRRERREQQMQRLEQKWPGAGAAPRKGAGDFRPECLGG